MKIADVKVGMVVCDTGAGLYGKVVRTSPDGGVRLSDCDSLSIWHANAQRLRPLTKKERGL